MSWTDIGNLAIIVTVIGALFAVIKMIVSITRAVMRGFQFFVRLEEHMLRIEQKFDSFISIVETRVSHGQD
jgi:hypothetical protein